MINLCRRRLVMPSPFPGMDPYLETPALWPDFHVQFLTCWSEALLDCLPGHYDARIREKGQHSGLASPWSKCPEPDVIVRQSRPPSPASVGGATLEPVTLTLVVEEETHERHIEILHQPDHTLVAVLELL